MFTDFVFRMFRSQTVGWSLLVLLCSSSVLHTIAHAHPQNHQPQAQDGFVPSRVAQVPTIRIERKFAEKPNAMKKVVLDEIDDIQTNQIQEGGFSWSNMLGKVRGSALRRRFLPRVSPVKASFSGPPRRYLPPTSSYMQTVEGSILFSDARCNQG